MTLTFEDRLRHLEDIDAIRQLRAKYCHLTDAQEWVALSELFTEDADFGGLKEVTGRKDIENFVRNTLPSAMNDWAHFTHTETIDIHGNIAKGKAKFESPCIVDEKAMVCAGHYDDEFTRTSDGWKFSKRFLTFYFFVPLEKGWGGGSKFPSL
jgi:hypothetical protein